MDKLTAYEFFKGVDERRARTGERKGQAAFNHLAKVRPELAAKLPPELDPFYVEDEEGLYRFAMFVTTNW